MIYNKRTIESFKNLHGGTGTVHISRKLTKEDAVSGMDMFAEVTVDAGASIGFHIHQTDAEAYYILQGEGIFIDAEQVNKQVYPGDLCLITKGQGHGLINPGTTPLKIIAIVWH